jgi:hypothetical protein
VRLTAQNILSRNLGLVAQPRRHWWHLRPRPAIPAWPGIRPNLAGSLLLEFSLTKCQLDYADFTRAQFTGGAYFTNFTGTANFSGAQFIGSANFKWAEFAEKADFTGAQFTDRADFAGAQFVLAYFKRAQFTDLACFGVSSSPTEPISRAPSSPTEPIRGSNKFV